MPVKAEPIAAGSRHGQLVAEYQLRIDGHYSWACRCDCGGWSIAKASNLRLGKTKSCGCGRGQWRHGHARSGAQTQAHKAWTAMKQRCVNPRDARFPDYGARGITVCDRWEIYENFLADMGENYEPSNCRWATPAEQARNTRRTRRFNFAGVSMLASEASEIMGVPLARLEARLYRGWEPRRALFAPAQKRQPPDAPVAPTAGLGSQPNRNG